MTTRHTEELLKKGEERKRMTEQLQEALTSVAVQIATSIPIGTRVEVAGRIYETFKRTSNLDYDIYLGIYEMTERGEAEYPVAFDSYVSPGKSYYLHRDFNAQVTVADRDSWLHFANHLPEVLAAFEANEQDAIDALRSAFERLRTIAESKN